MSRRFAKNILAAGLALVLMGGAAVDRSFRKAPPDAEPYHDRIVKAAQGAPQKIGDWAGQDVPIPEAAIQLLRPNVIVSKSYVNYMTGEAISFLLVDCTDARDILGHYPPVCYPNQGWHEITHEPRDWQAGDLKLTGTQYDFTRSVPEDRTETIADFMLLPNGKVGRDMTSVRQVARGLERYYGAAQVQVIMPSSLSQERKDEIVKTIAEGYHGIFKTILGGGDK